MSQLLSVSSMRRYFSIQVLVLHRIIEKRYVLLMRLKKLLSWKINMKTKMDLLIKLSRIHIKRMARFLSTPWHSRMMSPELTTNYQKVAKHQAARVSATQNNKMDNFLLTTPYSLIKSPEYKPNYQRIMLWINPHLKKISLEKKIH